MNSLYPCQEYLAVGLGNLIWFNEFSWLKNRKPDKKVGYTIFLYDITNDWEAHNKMAEIYEKNNYPEHARREQLRARIIKGQIR